MQDSWRIDRKLSGFSQNRSNETIYHQNARIAE